MALTLLVLSAVLARADFKSQVLKPADPPPVVVGDLTGAVGPTGAVGATGATGYTGAMGSTGATGAKAGTGNNPLSNIMQSMGGAGAGANGASGAQPGMQPGATNPASTGGTGAYNDSNYSPQSVGADVPAVGDPGQMGDTINCQRGGQSQCGNAEFKLDSVPDGYFAGLEESERKRRFIEWLKPVALYIQAKTGFPASIVMAQATHESGFGTGPAFSSGKNIFGRYCPSEEHGQTETGQAQLGDKVFEFRAVCNVPRSETEGDFYLNFPSHEHSIIAYINNLLHNGIYKDLQAAVRQARNDGRVLDYKQAITLIKGAGYATDANYVDKVVKHVQENGFEQLDRDPCASCLRQMEASGGTGSPGTNQ